MWYLRSKDFVTVADNSDYALTAPGADFVEEKAARNEIAARLLNPSRLVLPASRVVPPPRRRPQRHPPHHGLGHTRIVQDTNDGIGRR